MNECWPTRTTSFLRSALCTELWSWHRVGECHGVAAGKSACFDVKTVVEIDGLKAGPTRSHVALRSIPIERSKSSSRRTSSSSDSSNNLGTNSEYELALVFEKPGRYTLPILDITQIRCKYLHQGRASIQARDSLFLLTSTHQIELERLLGVIRDVKAVKILADSRMCSACKEKGELKKKKITQRKGQQQQQQPTAQECTFRKRQLQNLVDTDEEHVFHIKDLLSNRGHRSQKLSKMGMPLSEGRDFQSSEIDDELYHNASSSSEILSPEHTTAFRYSPVQTKGREAHLTKQSSPTKHEVFIDQIRRRNTLDGVRRRDAPSVVNEQGREAHLTKQLSPTKHEVFNDQIRRRNTLDGVRRRDAPSVVNEQRSVRSSDEEKENLDVGADEDRRKIKDETVKRSAQRAGTNEVLRKVQEEQRRVEEDKSHNDGRRNSELDERKGAEEKEKMLKRKESLRKLLEQERKRKDEWEAKREDERRWKEQEGKKLKAEEERLEKSLERQLQEEGRLGKDENWKEDEKRKEDERRRIFLDFRFQEEKRKKEDDDRRVPERKQREDCKLQEQKLREEERKLLDQKQREEERKLLDQKQREEERKLPDQKQREEERKFLDQKQREEERKLPDQKQREEERKLQAQEQRAEERKLLDQKQREEERKLLEQKQRAEERKLLDQKQREEARKLQDLKEREELHKLHKQKWRDEEYKGVEEAAGRSQELKHSEEDDNKFSEALRNLQEQIQEKRKRDEDIMQETLVFLKQEEDRQKLRKFQESVKITDRLSQRFRRNRVSAEGKVSPDEIRKILEEQLDKLDSRKLEEDMRRWRNEENDRRAKEDNWAMPHHAGSVLEEQRRRVEEVFSRRLNRNASERMKVDSDDRKQAPEKTEDFKVHSFSSAEVKRAPDNYESQKRYSQDRRFLDQLFSSRRMQNPRSEEGKPGKGGESFRPTETFVKADRSSTEELKKTEMERKKTEKAADEQKKRLAQERLKAAKLETKRLEKVLREAQKRAKAEERQSQQQKAQEQARPKFAAMAPPGLPRVHILTYRQYEDSWNLMKMSGKKLLLAYSDIPWPPQSNPLFVEPDDTLAVQRRKLRIALLRWHPDKFQSLCGNRLSPLDRGSIEARAKTIAQEVILWKSKLENSC